VPKRKRTQVYIRTNTTASASERKFMTYGGFPGQVNIRRVCEVAQCTMRRAERVELFDAFIFLRKSNNKTIFPDARLSRKTTVNLVSIYLHRGIGLCLTLTITKKMNKHTHITYIYTVCLKSSRTKCL